MAPIGSLRGWVTRLALAAVLCGSLPAAEANTAQLTASWIDNSGGVAMTRVERRHASETAYTAIADAAPGSEAFVDTSVATGTTYCYRVFAWMDDAVSPYTEEACATSATDNVTVAVTKAGTGTGVVTSSPSGINCGTSCSMSVAPGTLVTLTATAASGSVFDGWSGGGCTGTAPCAFATNSSVAVTASFSPAPVATPTVTLVVTGDPAAGPYAVEANASVTSGVTVRFYVDGALYRTENQWRYCLFGNADGAPCATGTLGAGAHTVRADVVDPSTSAVLASAQTTIDETPATTPPPPTTTYYSLTISVSGPGSVTCGGTSCPGTYPSGATVTLTATPNNKNAKLSGWGGACTGTAATCTVTMDGPKSVSATFKGGK